MINLPRNDVITLMDTGLVEHFISTRAFYVVSSSLYATFSFPQTAPPPPPASLLRNVVPVSNPIRERGKKAFLEIVGLSLECV